MQVICLSRSSLSCCTDLRPAQYYHHIRTYTQIYTCIYVHTHTWLQLLLCPQERWQSIVTSMSVCVSVRVCLSIYLSVCLRDISQTTRAIFTNFFVHVAYRQARSSSGRVTKSQGKGEILGVFCPIQKHCQSSLQLSLQRRGGICCKRDHSIANNVTQQMGSFSMPGKHKLYSENFRAQVMRPIGSRGSGGIAQCGQNLISTIALLVLLFMHLTNGV